jgi:hypothetical protein
MSSSSKEKENEARSSLSHGHILKGKLVSVADEILAPDFVLRNPGLLLSSEGSRSCKEICILCSR